ncbi:hypothetical protein [Paenibacillus sp. FSL E2-0201]|uniref:hypothetical protein n=1 Tax=Paenibacillus sp. FSL E2-0201 TaxID=2954726 RepID=UPI0030D73022
MNLKKGLLGIYNYLPMTKVDVLEHNRLNVKATAVHEYIHSYLTKGTLYGIYLITLNSLNRIDQKHERSLRLLISNMIRMQETVATLVELIYIFSKCGEDEMNNHLRQLTKPYSTYINDYRYLLNKDYAINLFKRYRVYLEDNVGRVEMEDFIEKFSSTSELTTALNILNFVIIRTAEIALNIDLRKIDKQLWINTNKIEKIINNDCLRYNPSTRFKKIMKSVLPDFKRNPNKEFMFVVPGDIYTQEIINDEMLYGIKEDVLSRYVDNEVINSQNAIHFTNTVDEDKYVQKTNILKIEELENESLLYAMPYILNTESANAIFGKRVKYLISDVEFTNIDKILPHSEIIHIHVTTGRKNQYKYYIGLSSDLNKNIKNNTANYDDVEIRASMDRLEEFQKLLSDYKGIMYFTGCNRTEHVLDSIDYSNNTNPIFVNSASSMKPSIDFVNKYFKGQSGFVIKSDFGDVLCVKKNNLIFFQPIIPGTYEVIKYKIYDGTICLNEIYYYDEFIDNILSKDEFSTVKRLLYSTYKSMTFTLS